MSAGDDKPEGFRRVAVALGRALFNCAEIWPAAGHPHGGFTLAPAADVMMG